MFSTKIYLFKCFLFLITMCNSLYAQKDSISKYSYNGFYATAYFPIIVRDNTVCRAKYCDSYELTTFERQKNSFRSPTIGFGFIVKHKKIYFNTSASYYFAYKKINYYSQTSVEDFNTPSGYSINGYFNSMLPYGYRYWSVNDTYTGTLNTHYLNYSICLGLNTKKVFSYYLNVTINNLLNYNYKGDFKRVGTQYEVAGGGPYNYSLVIIDNQELILKDKVIKNYMSQQIQSTAYLGLGCQYDFKIKTQRINLNFEVLRSILNIYTKNTIINLKVNYMFLVNKRKQYKN